MSKWLVAVVGVVFVLVIGANPQAQSVSDEPIIPLPIAATEPPADTASARADQPADPRATAARPTDLAGKPTGASPAAAIPAAAGSLPQPGTAFEVCYLFGYPDGVSPSQPEKAVSLVLWKAIGEGTKFDVAEMRERIALHPGAPSLSSPGVYALQDDYKVAKITLSAQETSRLFDLVRQGNGATLVSDNLWKGKIRSRLREVEWEIERPKALKKLAADKARAARKAAAKSSKSDKATPSAEPSKTAPAKKSSHATRGNKGTASGAKVKTTRAATVARR